MIGHNLTFKDYKAIHIFPEANVFEFVYQSLWVILCRKFLILYWYNCAVYLFISHNFFDP